MKQRLKRLFSTKDLNRLKRKMQLRSLDTATLCNEIYNKKGEVEMVMKIVIIKSREKLWIHADSD